jgi:hypothetical protein
LTYDPVFSEVAARGYVFVVVWADNFVVDAVTDVAGKSGVDGGAELDT